MEDFGNKSESGTVGIVIQEAVKVEFGLFRFYPHLEDKLKTSKIPYQLVVKIVVTTLNNIVGYKS